MSVWKKSFDIGNITVFISKEALALLNKSTNTYKNCSFFVWILSPSNVFLAKWKSAIDISKSIVSVLIVDFTTFNLISFGL